MPAFRQTDKPPSGAAGAGKNKGGRRPTERNQQAVLCGWNLPVLPDDNDIVGWMKREKNGDNKRKKVNEVLVEEQYRHITGHCVAIENKLLFDRQSLNDRYLKHCQYGVRDARASKVTQVTATQGQTQPVASSSALTAAHIAQHLDDERNCKSANAITDDRGVICEGGGGGEEVGDEEGEVGDETSDVVSDVGGRRGRRRSQSAVCIAALRKCGMTLPESRPVAVVGAVRAAAEDKVKDEGEDGDPDEGYGSKVSSNDHEHEHDPVEDDSLQNEGDEDEDEETPRADAQDAYVTSGDKAEEVTSVNRLVQFVPNGLQQQLRVTSHQDALAKLMYSRRERTVYERLPSRRMRGNGFRYAGREQSRLTEASLSHITPAYLARYHQLADLATMSRVKQEQHVTHEPVAQQQNGAQVSGDGAGGIQPRTMVLRKITIQDSSRDLFSQNVDASNGDSNPRTSPVSSRPFEAQHRRPGHRSPQRSDRSERNVVSETRSCPPRMTVRVQELSPGLSSGEPSAETPTTTAMTSSAHTISALSASHNSDEGTLTNGSSPRLSPSGQSSHGDVVEGGGGGGEGGSGTGAGNRIPTSMICFQITDLLPAVERNIRNRRTTQRSLDKSRTMDSINIVSMQARRQQFQQQQLQQQLQYQQQGGGNEMAVGGRWRYQEDGQAAVAGQSESVLRASAVESKSQVRWDTLFDYLMADGFKSRQILYG
nr:hypothetical protein BaRGS_023470 [Batillaria attramentaria]